MVNFAAVFGKRHERLEIAVAGVVLDVVAAARLHAHKAHALEILEPGVHHRAADVHLFGQLALRRETVADLQLTGKDHADDLIDEQLPERRGLNLLKSHQTFSSTFLWS